MPLAQLQSYFGGPTLAVLQCGGSRYFTVRIPPPGSLVSGRQAGWTECLPNAYDDDNRPTNHLPAFL